MHVEKEDRKLVGGREEDAEGGGRWRDSICVGAPEDPKVEEVVMNMSRRMKQDTVMLYLYGAVDSSGEEASSGDGQSCHAPLVSEQRLCTDHVVHAPHLDNTNTGRVK